MRSFIEVYDNILSEEDCGRLISAFEKSPKRCDGSIMLDGKPTVDYNFKQSIEIPDCYFSQSNVMSSIIWTPLNKCLIKYKKKYSVLDDGVSQWDIVDQYTFKKFETEKDGYKMWHCEHGSGVNSKRILVWMFYLNNARSGTEFMYHPNVKPKRGRCVIWPASWEYTHRGAPNKSLKYIVSGWMSYI